MSVRAEKAAVALRLRAEGKTAREIGAVLGVSRSYASSLCTDPDRSKDIARKASYGRTCLDCGARTDGSDGRARAAVRCFSCRKAWEIATKTWTREAVIDAVQRFAVENGRPPTATEWICATPAKHYPCRSSVYVAQAGSGSPFARWADAIEAAGLPRPRQGVYSYARRCEAQRRRRERERAAA